MAGTWNPTFDWDSEGWRDEAACRQTDPDLFFPPGRTGVAIEQLEAAKSVCRSCPVQHPCLQFALETNQEAGIWGGTDEDERRRLRRTWRAGRRSPMGSVIR
jgi:WhiB family redox-sensing transcriptional regulator